MVESGAAIYVMIKGFPCSYIVFVLWDSPQRVTIDCNLLLSFKM